MHNEQTMRAIADTIGALNKLTEQNADWPEDVYLEVKMVDVHGTTVGAFTDEVGEWLFTPGGGDQ